MAIHQFTAGDLHRAVRTLLSSGIYKAESFADLLAEAQEKFPDGASPAFGSASADHLTQQALAVLQVDLTDILDTTSLIQAIKRYSSFAGTDDQGWRIRQHLSPLSSHPAALKLYCKHILQGVLLGRMPDLLIPALSAIRRGGRFIPLSKGADKPGLRPIVIGSAHRRLATKLALAAIRSFLDQHFLSSHPRAIQFGLDRDGCLKFSQTASALLPLHARGDDEDVANPTVLVSLDAKNAFNSLDRQALFDAIEGRASRDYFDGSITEGASLPSCEHLRLFASYLSSYYGDSADLRLFHKSQSASVQCTSGVCQGDVPSSVFFCHSIHPLLLHIAELFPSVRVLAYADNVVLVGPLEDAVAATSAMKKYMLADLKLEIQPRESKVYIPSWHQHPDLSQLKKSLKRRLKTQLLHFEVVTGGITLGGLPIGTDGFHASQLRAKVSTLNEELSKLGLVQHGFMFKTLVRASHLQKLRFFLQGSSPFLPRVQSQIRRFDLSVHLALEKYHRWPSSQYLAAHPDLLEFARFKRELPHSRGGDEFTPSEGLHPAVYYTAIARFLAWYSDQPMSRTLTSPHSLDVHCSRSLRAQKHPLATFFVEAHDFVHNAGAILYRRVKAPAPAADGAAIPPAPAAVPDDAGRPPASVVHIPGLRALVDSSHEHFIPPPAQRNVTPLVMRVFPRHVHARAALTDQQRDILTLHSRRTHSLKSQDRVLQSTIFAHFPERDLSHSPMRVSSYYPLKAFPHRYAQMLDCYLHGMPICQCPTECDGCQRELDPSVAAHHLQTCKRRSSKLPTAHDNLTRTIRSMLNEAGLQSVIDTVGDPRSRRQVPSHPHGRKMKGDIHIPGIRDRGSEQYEGLMADVTLVHPYIGSSADLTKWGEVNLDALHVAASEKIRKHRAAYAMTTPPRAFIPLAISTDGTLHPDTLRFIWYLADIIAQRSMPLEALFTFCP